MLRTVQYLVFECDGCVSAVTCHWYCDGPVGSHLAMLLIFLAGIDPSQTHVLDHKSLLGALLNICGASGDLVPPMCGCQGCFLHSGLSYCIIYNG